MSVRVWRLIIAAALFFGWIGWLGYAALKKSHGPVVSRVQAAAATHPVVAQVNGDSAPSIVASVVEPLTGEGPAKGSEIKVLNLPDTSGFTGSGQYLLLLVKDTTSDAYYVIGQQRSPGFDLSGVGAPAIYRWSPDVDAQVRKLFPRS